MSQPSSSSRSKAHRMTSSPCRRAERSATSGESGVRIGRRRRGTAGHLRPQMARVDGEPSGADADAANPCYCDRQAVSTGHRSNGSTGSDQQPNGTAKTFSECPRHWRSTQAPTHVTLSSFMSRITSSSSPATMDLPCAGSLRRLPGPRLISEQR
jgi:hypothetical protein